LACSPNLCPSRTAPKWPAVARRFSYCVQSGIVDVDIEIRESFLTFLEGPKLLVPTLSSDPTVDVRNPLAPSLGLLISGKPRVVLRVLAAFFIAEGGGSKRLFLICLGEGGDGGSQLLRRRLDALG
jgi:hypothetical protein